MSLSKTVFKRKDFFGGRKSAVHHYLQAVDPHGKVFKNPKRKRDMINKLQEAGSDGKVTFGEVRDALKHVVGTHHVSGSAHREITRNMGFKDITSGEVHRFMQQQNALKKALGKHSSRSDLPQPKSRTDSKNVPEVHNVHKIPVKGEDVATTRRNDQVQRMNKINQESTKTLLETMNGNVTNSVTQSDDHDTQSPTYRFVV